MTQKGKRWFHQVQFGILILERLHREFPSDGTNAQLHFCRPVSPHLRNIEFTLTAPRSGTVELDIIWYCMKERTQIAYGT